MRHFWQVSLALTLFSPAAGAQIRLPVLPIVSRPLNALDQSLDEVESRSLAALSEVRSVQVARMIRSNPKTVDVDDHGNPVVRSEVLALSPSESALRSAAALHFVVLREQSMEGMGVQVVVLGSPSGLSTKKALRQLRAADPGGTYDFNHIYTGSGIIDEPAERSPDPGAVAAGANSTAAANTEPATTSQQRVRVGLVDSGIDTGHGAFKHATVHAFGCGARWVPDEHGTAVASLMIGQAGQFHGVRPDAELFAADVYCGMPTGGAVDALVAAFNWMVHQQVPVINVSLVGPANLMLEHAVAALSGQGFLIVAAVGNDGPAAPPLYPASYPQVVGVTAVDAHNKVLIEAARGRQVMFASPGADLAAAGGKGGYSAVRGTSFAAPIVAALLAGTLSAPNPSGAAAAIDALAKSAVDLGPPGRDLTYGFGLVGAEYRIDPAILVHR
jgi:subtilisin family serine protease